MTTKSFYKREIEFLKLSWFLLEAKVRYYLYPEIDNISDAEYDKKERRYLSLCKQLYRLNTIQSMVGIDQTRPSVQAAINKVMNE